jgi:hypothetical protein
MATLLIAELHNIGPEFAITDPLWVGVAINGVYALAWYSLLYSVVMSVSISCAAMITETPSQVVPPVVALGVGIALYEVCRILVEICKWFNFYVDLDDLDIRWGNVPNDGRVAHYVVRAVPQGLFLFSSPFVIWWLVNNQILEARLLEFAGVRFGDAEEYYDLRQPTAKFTRLEVNRRLQSKGLPGIRPLITTTA